jgi:hypothetical protein
VLAAPAVSCARCTKKCAHEHTGTVGTLRHSLRNGFTAYAVLSPATNSSCHRRQRISGRSKPGRVRKASASLTPATGARTTRFCRTHQRRSSCAPYSLTETALRTLFALDAAASTASRPNVRDDGQRPSSRDEIAGVLVLIWGGGEADYFRGRDWTGQITLKLLQKIAPSRCWFDPVANDPKRTLSGFYSLSWIAPRLLRT